jgi:hypothetical protein
MGQRDGARVKHDSRRIGVFKADGDTRVEGGHGRFIALPSSRRTDKSVAGIAAVGMKS